MKAYVLAQLLVLANFIFVGEIKKKIRLKLVQPILPYAEQVGAHNFLSRRPFRFKIGQNAPCVSPTMIAVDFQGYCPLRGSSGWFPDLRLHPRDPFTCIRPQTW